MVPVRLQEHCERAVRRTHADMLEKLQRLFFFFFFAMKWASVFLRGAEVQQKALTPKKTTTKKKTAVFLELVAKLSRFTLEQQNVRKPSSRAEEPRRSALLTGALRVS